MMKRFLSVLLGLTIYTSLCFAGYDDGFIKSGEYEWAVEWYTYDPPLIVEGGCRWYRYVE
jgi:hypothetical protein